MKFSAYDLNKRKIIWIAECRYLMKKVRIPMQEEVDVPVLH